MDGTIVAKHLIVLYVFACPPSSRVLTCETKAATPNVIFTNFNRFDDLLTTTLYRQATTVIELQ